MRRKKIKGKTWQGPVIAPITQQGNAALKTTWQGTSSTSVKSAYYTSSIT